MGQSLFKNDCRAADAKTQEVMGCTSDLPEYQWMDILGVEVRRCPYCTVTKTPEVFQLIKLHRLFKMGFLPWGGGVMDQSPVLMDAFEIIDRVEASKNNVSQSNSN